MPVPALGAHEAGTGLQQRVKPGLVMVGTSGTEGGYGRVDEARVQLRERVVIDAVPPRGPRSQVLDGHVRFPRQVVNDLTPFRAVQIDRESTFPLIPTEKSETEGAEGVTL